jgi:hypothetical protein
VRMDETRIDDRIDASARVGDGPSSHTRSPLHLASLSSEPLGSPYTDGSPVVQQENAALRQRIEELESASVHAPDSPSVSVHVSIYSGFAREYALGSTSSIPCLSFV